MPARVRRVCRASSCVVISRGVGTELECPSGWVSEDGLGARDEARVRVRFWAQENRGLAEALGGNFCELGEGERGLGGMPLKEAEEGEALRWARGGVVSCFFLVSFAPLAKERRNDHSPSKWSESNSEERGE